MLEPPHAFGPPLVGALLRMPPDVIREPIGDRWPDQGSVLVGTEGLIVLPHMT